MAAPPSYELLIFNLRTFYGPSNQMVLMPTGLAQEGNESMSLQEVSAEQFAQLFHQYQRALANDPASSVVRDIEPWTDVPPSEKSLMIAAARLALLEVELLPSDRKSRKYFAKPGEAEWGC